jgi:hypothetical protein
MSNLSIILLEIVLFFWNATVTYYHHHSQIQLQKNIKKRAEIIAPVNPTKTCTP